MKLPSIRVYTPETGISTTQSRLKTARPTEGLPTFAAQELHFNSIRQGLDNLVEEMWPDYSVFQITRIASMLLSVTVTPKEIYSSHLRTRRERDSVDKNQDKGQKD